MTDSWVVRMVVVALAVTVIGGMAGQLYLTLQVINAPADRVKDAALMLTAFSAMPTTALGALAAVLVSTRSGPAEPPPSPVIVPGPVVLPVLPDPAEAA